MRVRWIRGRNIPWDEFDEVVCRESWWIERVRRTESDLGYEMDGTMRDLALMASFNCCRFHADFPINILKACEAIGEGNPCAGRSCCHVSPEQWEKANEYVAAIQGRIMGRDPQSLAEEGNHDPSNISRVYAMMGERLTPTKEALFKRYLFVLINRLKWATNFNLLGDGSLGDSALTFRDFDDIYRLDDETHYYDLQKDSPQIEELDGKIVQGIRDGEVWISRLDAPEQPLCQQKYLRYQDIRISSLGCGEWRGAVPPGKMSKERVLGLIEAFDAALKAWSDGKAVKERVYDLIATKLGKATAEKRGLVRNFLLHPSYSAYDWLKDLDRPKSKRGRGY